MESAIKRVGVIGVGHLGQHHARVYTELLDARLVGVADRDEGRSRMIGDNLGVPAYSTMEELIDRQAPDAVSIVVPTSLHYDVAKRAMEAGIHVLIEKPVTTRPDEAEDLLKLAARNDLVLQVGHIERFNSAVRYISQTVHTPIYLESKRIGPFSPRINDVGVVLDLMIHDIDIILSLVPSPIARIAATGRCVHTDHEDIADAQIAFENGVMAHILVSRVSEKRQRQLDIMEPQRHISVNYETQTVQISRCVRDGGGQTEILETPIFPKSEPLKLELAHFISCVRERRQPLVGIRDGKRALEVAIEVLRQIHDSPEGRGAVCA
ncbi:MAG: Gfo/Idh/MocA family oxidoreductase [Fretibacterium sp.]|uniref:Gfo/Idh/MocA family protein n=1 Tax=Fretibacterium sp. OH1220_COT-178 TaxID=2491047 RepID=UPI000F5FE02C|nr:Gfo/Idh/MocA family oxidoreductase [Fretibacterium sp. OH1220_COT-178]MDO4786958.1 Gfo/Idh/MocA family oxidoreductase [Fretibacterium sp.]RRD66279.1 gfo/Idh/MocA family oxidoreductase [Fretibacterium sp. OH1220_COT-178]